MPARVAEGARVCRSRPIDSDSIRWANNFKGEEGLETYRRETNMVSIDSLPSGWLDEV
jgi:hypothetical protein